MRVLCLLISILLPAADPVKEFKRAFKRTKNPFSVVEKRRQAFESIQSLTGEAVEKALLEACAVCEVELRQLEKDRSAILVASGKKGAFRELRSRQFLDPQRQLARSLQQHLLGIEKVAGPRDLARAAMSNDRLPFTLRLGLLEQHGGSLRRNDIAKKLNHRGLQQRVLALRAMTKGRREVFPMVQRALKDGSPLVRQQAATALGRIHLPECVPVLVHSIEGSKAETQNAIASALLSLTGQPLGTSATAWKSWLCDHEADPLAGAQREPAPVPKGKRKGTNKKGQSKESTGGYYGLPVTRGSVCFVIDNSQSMKVRLTGEYGKEGPMRITRAKTELKRILQQLKPETQFNVVAFAREAIAFSESMQQAKPATIAEAIQWVDALPTKLGTALYDGLDFAFRQAGRPVGDSFYTSRVDTYYVLSDGLPMRMHPDPMKKGLRGDARQEILAAVSEWNLLDRSTVHVIGMGKSIPHKFLGKLASQNGGRYVRGE